MKENKAGVRGGASCVKQFGGSCQCLGSSQGMLHGGGDILVMSQGSRETQTLSPTRAGGALGVSRCDNPRDPNPPCLPGQERGTHTGPLARLQRWVKARSRSSQAP